VPAQEPLVSAHAESRAHASAGLEFDDLVDEQERIAVRDDLLDLLAPEWRCEHGHGAYRSHMPQAPIRVHELESCDSTQDELRVLADGGAPAFTAVRADVQRAVAAGAGEAGSTRRYRAAGLDPAAACATAARAAHAQPWGGIAAVECARMFGAGARLSWPNDVVCGQRKLAGVLAELGRAAACCSGSA